MALVTASRPPYRNPTLAPHLVQGIAVDQTTTFSPGEMMCDGVNGWRRSDCSRAAVEKTQITKMAPHESALMAPGAGAAMTEACHVPLDRRGTPRTCYLVADKFGFANCQTVAPPALGDMQEGRAAVPGGTATAQSCPGFRRQSVKAATARIGAVTTPRWLRTGRNTDRR